MDDSMSSRIVDDNHVRDDDSSWDGSSSEEEHSDNSLFDEPPYSSLIGGNQTEDENVSHAYLISIFCTYSILLHLSCSF